MPESHAPSNLPEATGKLRRWAMLAVAGYWCLIFTLTHVDFDDDPLPGDSDKLAHMLAYSGLSFLLAWALRLAGKSGLRLALLVLSVVVAYGAFDELSQIPVGRKADVLDWLADCAGGTLGYAAFLISKACIRRRQQA